MIKRCLMLASLLFVMLSLMPATSFAEKRPIQLALFNPVQIFPEDYSIGGVRFNLIYGKNAWVSGVDFGLVNHTTSGLTKGWQFGLVGVVEEDFLGFQDNFINITRRNFEGFQWGFVNYAYKCNGLQLGLVNYAVTMKGLQIGLVNIIKQGGQFPVFPIVNWSF
ncbi:MAG: hypothetical protein AB1483_10215 [Candidatus Zixiibacteriota bacterium]